jgi:hypothetical protein
MRVLINLSKENEHSPRLSPAFVLLEQKQNPAGRWQGFGRYNRIKDMFNVFPADEVYGGPIKTVETRRPQIRRPLSLVPLFASFFGNHNTASGQENYSNHNKYNSNWQGQLLSLDPSAKAAWGKLRQ